MKEKKTKSLDVYQVKSNFWCKLKRNHLLSLNLIREREKENWNRKLLTNWLEISKENYVFMIQ